MIGFEEENRIQIDLFGMLIKEIYPAVGESVTPQKILGQKRIPEVGFVQPHFFPKAEFVQFKFRQMGFKVALYPFQICVVSHVTNLKHHAVQFQGKIGKCTGQLILAGKPLGLGRQFFCPVGNTSGDVLGLYAFFQFDNFTRNGLFLVIHRQSFGLVQEFEALLIQAFLVENCRKIQLLPNLNTGVLVGRVEA